MLGGAGFLPSTVFLQFLRKEGSFKVDDEICGGICVSFESKISVQKDLLTLNFMFTACFLEMISWLQYISMCFSRRRVLSFKHFYHI